MLEPLDKKEVRRIAKAKLSEGIPKQQVYDELLSTYLQSKAVARIVESIPSARAKKKYGGWNIFLWILFAIMAVMDFLGGDVSGFVIDVLFIIAISGYKVKYYQWISIRAVMTIIMMIAYVDFGNLDPLSIVVLVINSSFVITLLVLGLWLTAKLCPSPLVKKVMYTNKQGQKRLRPTYVFKEE